MSWFRLWTDILDDPKMAVTETLPETFRETIMLMAYAKELNNGGKIDQPIVTIAWRLRTSPEELSKHLAHLSKLKIIELKPIIRFINWEKRQPGSDSSTERVRKYRNGMKPLLKRNETVTETAPDTDSDTDSEQKQSKIFFQIYDVLMTKVKAYRPNHKNGHKTADIKHVRLMIDRDKRDYDLTLKLLDWYPIGEKFIPEIFSAKSLREKYEKLLNAYNRRNNQSKEPQKEPEKSQYRDFPMPEEEPLNVFD
jgi:DNA-binding Lrp family transcriptional regulator